MGQFLNDILIDMAKNFISILPAYLLGGILFLIYYLCTSKKRKEKAAQYEEEKRKKIAEEERKQKIIENSKNPDLQILHGGKYGLKIYDDIKNYCEKVLFQKIEYQDRGKTDDKSLFINRYVEFPLTFQGAFVDYEFMSYNYAFSSPLSRKAKAESYFLDAKKLNASHILFQVIIPMDDILYDNNVLKKKGQTKVATELVTEDYLKILSDIDNLCGDISFEKISASKFIVLKSHYKADKMGNATESSRKKHE